MNAGGDFKQWFCGGIIRGLPFSAKALFVSGVPDRKFFRQLQERTFVYILASVVSSAISHPELLERYGFFHEAVTAYAMNTNLWLISCCSSMLAFGVVLVIPRATWLVNKLHSTLTKLSTAAMIIVGMLQGPLISLAHRADSLAEYVQIHVLLAVGIFTLYAWAGALLYMSFLIDDSRGKRVFIGRWKRNMFVIRLMIGGLFLLIFLYSMFQYL